MMFQLATLLMVLVLSSWSYTATASEVGSPVYRYNRSVTGQGNTVGNDVTRSMMEYQKSANREARQDRMIQRSNSYRLHCVTCK